MKKVLSFVVFSLCSIFIFNNPVDALWIESVNDNLIVNSLTEEFKLEVTDIQGTVKFVVEDESVLTIDENGIITPLKDGYTYISATDDAGTLTQMVIITAFGTINEELQKTLDEYEDHLVLPYTDSFINFSKETNNDLLIDYVWASLTNYGKVNADITLSDDFKSATITMQKTWVITNEDDSISYVSFKSDISKTVDIEFHKTDKKIFDTIKKATANVKSTYNSYLNESYEDMFSTHNINNQELMLKATSFFKDLNLEDVEYKIDARLGNNTPGQAMYGGYILLGMDGVYYGCVEIEVHQVLMIPTLVKGQNLLDAIHDYISEFLANEDEDVKVEEIAEQTYRATITKKKSSSAISFLTNLLIPRVSAEEEAKVIEFKIEQNDDVLTELNNTPQTPEPPNTLDNITTYVIILCVSFGGLITIKKLKKQ